MSGTVHEATGTREGEILYGIEVRKSGAGMTVELRGEFDLFSLSDLRRTLGSVLDPGRSAIVDLSGITFLDLNSARELAVHSQLYALYLRDPSPQVTASLDAFRLSEWFSFHPGTDREEPPLVSETSS